jgi:ferredoxin
MNNVEIYYFSGTGNTLHVVKELKKRIPDVTMIPILSLLKKDVIKTNAKIVGIVFPLYLATLPIPVKEFINKLDITSAEHTFSIITRIGFFSVSNVYINKVLKKSGRMLDAAYFVNMANNSPAGLKPFADQKWIDKLTNDKLIMLEEKVQEKLNFIAESVLKKEKIYSKGTISLVSKILEPVMTKITQKQGKIPFYADKTCNKCGICEKVCLSGKVKIIDGEVIWDKSVQCYYCYACFNFCPIQSILVGEKYTLKNGRYHHFDVDCKEIVNQKNK